MTEFPVPWQPGGEVSPRQLDDVTLLTPPPGWRVVVATDSVGAIGPKELDQVKVDGYVVGRFACRVPLMEIMAIGGVPVLVVNTLCVEPEPAGERITAGVSDEVREAGLDPAVVLTGSSEKNVATSQTGLGVTVIGLIPPATKDGFAAGYHQPGRAPGTCESQRGLRWGRSRKGDLVVCIGRPKVGSEVRLGDEEIADIPTLRRLLSFPELGDAIPVGSAGISSEARKLARRSGNGFIESSQPDLDYSKSGGPATCLLATVEPKHWPALSEFMAITGRPCRVVGRIG